MDKLSKMRIYHTVEDFLSSLSYGTLGIAIASFYTTQAPYRLFYVSLICSIISLAGSICFLVMRKMAGFEFEIVEKKEGQLRKDKECVSGGCK